MNDPQPQPPQRPDGPPPVVYYMPPQDYLDDEINLLDYWRVLMAYKWSIMFVTLLCTAAAIAVAVTMTPVYRAEVLLAPADEESGGGMSALASQFGGLASLAGVNLSGGGGGGTEQAIATLSSRAFINQFLQDRQLMAVFYPGGAKPASLPRRVLGWAGVTLEPDPPTLWDAHKWFSEEILKVTSDKTTGLVTLAIEWSDPAQAAEWSDELVRRLNRTQQQEAIREARKSIDYLNKELEQTGVVEMQQAIYRLIEAQTKNIMVASVRDQYAFKVIDPAVVPEEPIKPKKALIAVLGLVVGLFLGILLAFIRSAMRRHRESAQPAS